MGFFQTIIWVFFGVIIIIGYIALMGRYVSKGFHIWGLPIPEEKYQSIKKQYNMGLVFLILLVFLTPFVFPKPKEDPNAWKTENNKTMAYVMMQEFVKRNLVSPGSAKFEWISEPDCKITKDGFDYTISSWVDSQNAFGAVLRTRFAGIVRQVDKDNWELVALDFDE
jgi:hypothetical protein